MEQRRIIHPRRRKRGGKPKVFVPKEKYEEMRKCFKCQWCGLITSNCPTRKTLTIRQYLSLREEEELYEFVPKEMNIVEDEE